MLAVFKAPLAAWQQIKALKTYVRLMKSQADGVDQVLVKGIKHALRLPTTTALPPFTPLSANSNKRARASRHSARTVHLTAFIPLWLAPHSLTGVAAGFQFCAAVGLGL